MRRAVCQPNGQKNQKILTKSSRDFCIFSSRDISYSHKVQSRLSSSFIYSHTVRDYQNQTRLSTRIQSSLYHHTHTYLRLVEICAIICTYTSRYTYIMHKCVYTVTLDIECWNDLKVDKIDWAKSINLFPDEFIHSSVQELTSPRPVDSI